MKKKTPSRTIQSPRRRGGELGIRVHFFSACGGCGKEIEEFASVCTGSCTGHRPVRPGGVSFTYNNPAARISLQSKLASAMQKTVDKSRRFSAWRRVRDSNPRDLSVYSISSVVYHWQIRGWSRSLRAALSNAENPGTARACGHSGPYRPETIRTAPEFK